MRRAAIDGMSGPLSLLLVDDNPDDRTLVAREIHKAMPDARVDEVGDEAALQALLDAGRQWDVAITDYQLRWSTGLDVFHRLRAAWAGLPVIMFTDSGSEELAVEALKQGVDDYITKTPRHYARVPHAIRACIEHAQRREEAARAGAALRRSEALLSLALEAARMGTWRYRADTGELDVHRRFARMLDDTGAPVDARAWLATLEDADAARLREAVGEALARGRRFELECHSPRRACWWRIAGIPDERGGVVGVVEDISARKQVEAQLRDADRQKDQFIATLGHELRNPIAPIRYALDLLTGDADPARIARVRAVIARQSDTMAHLLGQLLDSTRIARADVTLHRSGLDLVPLVCDAVDDARVLASAAGLAVEATLPDGPVPIDGDRIRLKQVFDNLLQNAIKFTPRDGRIQVTLEQDGEVARVSVADTGIGIPEAMLDRVFEPLVQVDAGVGAAARGGLGIGLAVVRQLVGLHGGTATASSAGPGQGTTLRICLPLAQAAGTRADPCGDDSAALPAQPDAAPAASTASSAPRCRVLVADDQPDAAHSLALALELHGCEVRTALDGLQARAIAEQWRPDTALLDIGMPGLSGDALARVLREQPWGRTMRLVAITGWGSDEDRVRLREAGFDAHLVKPVPVEVVLAEVHRGTKATDVRPA